MAKERIAIGVKLTYVELMERGASSYQAVKILKKKHPKVFCPSQVRRWYLQRDELRDALATGSRARGAGRRPMLGELEELLFDEFLHLRAVNTQVKRFWVAARAK